MKLQNNIFKQKIQFFSLSQVILLTFALIASVILRILLCPHCYLEAKPMYILVAFFFVVSVFQFAVITSSIEKNKEFSTSRFRKGIAVRFLFTLLVGVAVSVFMSVNQFFFIFLFLFFFLLETLFDFIFYPRLLRTIKNSARQ